MGAVPVPPSMSFADLYGPKTPGAGSPNAPTDTEKASGQTGSVKSVKPTTFWLALVGLLVLARVLWERGS